MTNTPDVQFDPRTVAICNALTFGVAVMLQEPAEVPQSDQREERTA